MRTSLRGSPRATRIGAARSAPGRSASLRGFVRARPRAESASCTNAPSRGTRQRSTDSQTTPTRSGAVPPRRSDAISLARSSTVPRVPAPSRKRTAPSRDGPVAALSENSSRSTCTSAGGRAPGAWRESSSIAPPARPARSSTVRSSAANAALPGSYGTETVTSVRAASASSSAHSAPVRSSNP